MRKTLSYLFITATIAATVIGCGIESQSSATDENTTVIMQIGNPVMTVNGEKKSVDEDGSTPVIVNERTLLPVRAVIESIGGKVEWEAGSKMAILNYGENEIRLVIDSNTAYINGEAAELDTAPAIINDRTMLPIRFIAESFGLNVGWNGEKQEVTITTMPIGEPLPTVNTSTTQTQISRIDISFDFNRTSTMASNQYAVWVEDADGALVKTLAVTDFTARRRGYRNREVSLSAWVAAANPDSLSDSEIDAVSSATPRDGEQLLSWDLTDNSGVRVSDGVYKIKVEGTLFWSSNILYTAEFDTADAAADEIAAKQVRSEPDNTDNEKMIENVRVTLVTEAKEASLKDGSYSIAYDSVDSHGWRAFLNMTVDGGKITSDEFNYYNAEGGLKTVSDEYTKNDAARLVIEAFPVLEQKLIDTQNPDEVDAVSSATFSSGIFKDFASRLYEAALQGSTEAIIVPQPDIGQ